MDWSLLTGWYAANAWYGGLLVFLLGLCVGSFLNVCIYRIPNKISIRKPPSHCPECKARLSAAELVPVASWLLLRGRCRHCGKPISPHYLGVELLTGALYLICWWRLPRLEALVPALVLTGVLVASAFIDAEHSIIPNGIVLFGAVAGAVCAVTTGRPAARDALLGALAGGAPLMAIDVVSRMILRKDGMGGGDVKLMAMAGLFLGWKAVLLALVLAVAAGGLAGAVLLALRVMKKGDYFPFGPFLAAGCFVSLAFGSGILESYHRFNDWLVRCIVG
jgi:leader peptidase (prepilin peptidase)/N-methyltransferase